VGEWKSKLDFNPIYTFKVNEPVIGTYQGARTVDKITSVLHGITINDTRYDFYGCGSLDKQLADIEAGTLVKILYTGKKSATVQIGNKPVKKDVHNYIVYTQE
jgi:hypothetical protein